MSARTGVGAAVRRARAYAARLARAVASGVRRLGWRLGLGRVPVVYQMTESDCGAACLAMLLAYHGHELTLGELRERFGVGRDGMSGLAIARGARGAGLSARGVSVSAADLDRLPLPAVAHWERRHFVVVERVESSHVWIVDPGAGRRRLRRVEFEASFTGVAVVAEGRVAERRQARGRVTLGGYVALMRAVPGAGRLAALVLAASVSVQLAGAVVPAFTKYLVDDVAPAAAAGAAARAGAEGAMRVVAAAMLVVVAARAVTSLARGCVAARLSRRLDAALTGDFIAHLLRLPHAFFRHRTDGDLLVRLSAQAGIRETLTAQILSVALDGPLALAFLAVLASVSPALAVVTLAGLLPQLAVIGAAAARTRELTERAMAARAEEHGCAVEVVKGVAAIKAAGAEGRVLARWSALCRAQIDAAFDRAIFAARVESALGGLRLAAPLAALWVGVHEVVAGRAGLGTMLAATALAANVIAPLTVLSQHLQQVHLLRAYVARVADVLETPAEQAGRATDDAPPLSGAIELRHVTAGYDGGPAVLHGVSLRVAPGEKVGIVGGTGSGKSTLVKVLVGLVEPVAGEVRFDDLPLAALDYRSVRAQCGVVLQEPALLAGSIRDNVALTVPGASDAEVRAALDAVGLAAEVDAMPLGVDTPVGDGGGSLSGGQRQRVALARALLARPRILVLDEATSHLDAATEAQVAATLRALRCTRVVIAHRLTTVADADRVVVLRDGRVVEEGPPDALLAAGGEYAALVGARRVERGAAPFDCRLAGAPGRLLAAAGA